MTLQDVAAETRIAVRHLTALEEGRFDGFAAPVYVMGFARNYARAVGVPRDWISDCLRAEVDAQFGQRDRFDLGWSSEGAAHAARFGRTERAYFTGVGFGPVHVQAAIFQPDAVLASAKVICASSRIATPFSLNV